MLIYNLTSSFRRENSAVRSSQFSFYFEKKLTWIVIQFFLRKKKWASEKKFKLIRSIVVVHGQQLTNNLKIFSILRDLKLMLWKLNSICRHAAACYFCYQCVQPCTAVFAFSHWRLRVTYWELLYLWVFMLPRVWVSLHQMK